MHLSIWSCFNLNPHVQNGVVCAAGISLEAPVPKFAVALERVMQGKPTFMAASSKHLVHRQSKKTDNAVPSTRTSLLQGVHTEENISMSTKVQLQRKRLLTVRRMSTTPKPLNAVTFRVSNIYLNVCRSEEQLLLPWAATFNAVHRQRHLCAASAVRCRRGNRLSPTTEPPFEQPGKGLLIGVRGQDGAGLRQRGLGVSRDAGSRAGFLRRFGDSGAQRLASAGRCARGLDASRVVQDLPIGAPRLRWPA